MKPSKNMDLYYDLYSHKTQFFSSYNPDMIEEALLSELRNQKVEPDVSDSKYKIKFTIYGKDQVNLEAPDNVEMVVRILRVPDQDVCCVEFSRLNGRPTTFAEHFEQITSECLSFANDTQP